MKILKILRPTKALLVISFFCYTFFALTAAASAQSPPDTAFYQLEDTTGYGPIPEHLADSINAAALSLREALPEDYRSDFAVYDLGFYHHHSSLVGGIPIVMQQAIADLTTPYYLFLGREMDNEGSLKKVWVHMELPEGGDFSCWSEINWLLSYNSVSVFVDSLVKEHQAKNITISNLLIKSIDKAEEIADVILDCCLSANSFCAECSNPKDILQYYRGEGYTEEKIEILLDSEGLPIILDNQSDSLILNFSDYVYRSQDEYMPEIFDKTIDPHKSLLWEIEGLNAPPEYDVIGILLSNDVLCSSPPSALRSINSEAIDLFNSGFAIKGKVLVIVKHMWQNPDGSGNDLLFVKYLYASYGSFD